METSINTLKPEETTTAEATGEQEVVKETPAAITDMPVEGGDAAIEPAKVDEASGAIVTAIAPEEELADVAETPADDAAETPAETSVASADDEKSVEQPMDTESFEPVVAETAPADVDSAPEPMEAEPSEPIADDAEEKNPVIEKQAAELETEVPKSPAPAEPIVTEDIKPEPVDSTEPLNEIAAKDSEPMATEATPSAVGENKESEQLATVTETNNVTSDPTTVPVVKTNAKRPKFDVDGLPTRQYLDTAIVPILLRGLSSLAKTRPDDPIKYLANYLLENKDSYESQVNSAPGLNDLPIN